MTLAADFLDYLNMRNLMADNICLKNENAVDCSGFMSWIINHCGNGRNSKQAETAFLLSLPKEGRSAQRSK